MKNSKSLVVPVIILVAASLFMYFLGSGDGPPYVSNSRGNMGSAVLYDTLSRLGFNVGRSQRPLTARTSTSDVYIIIEPRSPWVTRDMAEVMLDWVYMGGRLIFLQNTLKTHIDCILECGLERVGEDMSGFTLFIHGQGEVLTGQSRTITNINLANNSAAGHVVFTVLTQWDADRVRFADYYHGFHAETTLVGSLPFVIQLFLLQILIFSFAVIWHLGKRFGAAVPYYTVIEREENEYLRSLARLYFLAKKRRRNRA